MTPPTDHPRFLQQIEVYLAGGLSDDDRAAMDAHAADCPACAAALAAARETDRAMQRFFAAARPDAGFEDRVIGRLRGEPRRRKLPRALPSVHPLVRRAATGVAAAVLLGGVGYAAHRALDGGDLPTPWATKTGFDQSAVSAAVALEQSTVTDLRVTDVETRGWYEWNRRPLVGAAGEKANRGEPPAAATAAPAPTRHDFTPQQMAAEANEQARLTLNYGDQSGVSHFWGAVQDNEQTRAKELTDLRAGDETYAFRFPARSSARAGAGGAAAADRPADAQLGTVAAGVEVNTPAVAPGKLSLLQGPAGQAEELSKLQQRNTELETALSDRANRLQVAMRQVEELSDETQYLREQSPAMRGASARAGQEGQPGFRPAEAFGTTAFAVTDADPLAAVEGKDVRQLEELKREDLSQLNKELAAGSSARSVDQFDSILLPTDDGAEPKGTNEARETGAKPGSGERLAEDAARAIRSAREASERDRQSTVSDLEKVAQRLITEGRAEDARGVVDQIKVLDPQNAYALQAEGNLNGRAPQAAGSGNQAPQAPQPPAAAAAALSRKIIRNGEMTFEVDGFDSAMLQVSKIAAEEGGFVSTTASEKLPNGKVKGSVIVRVPPDRLDTLVLKLRGLGDLKSSRIAAQDVTKQYTDVESQLKAARAMEERLLEIIRTGKGEIKDLIEAEKQLGTWREKIELLEGEIRYMNNLISLSTLTVNLYEREIRTASQVSEAELVNMGVETEDVEQARASALKAIEEAKGRVIESDLKKLEAGQYMARIVAEAKPEAAGPLIDRLKQVGRVARLEIGRKQVTPEGTTVPPGGVRVERADTRFVLSLYNLANVAPRTGTNLNLAAADVETAYRTILDQVRSAGGRIVTSQLNRQGPTQTTGTVTFQVPTEQADVVLGALRSAGEVMKLDVTQNPDTQNTTESKRGFVVQVFALASVPARETTELQIAANQVASAFNALRESVRTAGGRILTSQLSAQDAASASGTLVFEVPREQWGAVDQALQSAGEVVSRSVTRAAEGENAVDTKIRLSVTLVDEARLNPRQTVDMKLAVSDVSGAYAKLLEALRAANARVHQSQLADQQSENVTGTLVFDVRGEAARAAVEKAIDDAGDVFGRTVNRSADAANVIDDKTRLSVSLIDADRLPPRETTTMGLEVPDVERSKGALEATAVAAGGTVTSTVSRERSGNVLATLTIHVPLGKEAEVLKAARDQGKVLVIREESDPTVPAGALTRARVNVMLASVESIVAGDDSLWASVKRGLNFSARGLLWSLQWVIVGLCFVLPWALIVWAVARVVRRSRSRRETVTAAPPSNPPPGAPATV